MMTNSSSKRDFAKVKCNPSGYFRCPDEVLGMLGLTNEEKLQILRQWEVDARLLAVAEEENMPGDQPNPLDSILKAIEALTGLSRTGTWRRGDSPSKLGV